MTGPAERVRALICEDEPIAVRALRRYLEDVDWIEVVGDARNGRDALRLIHKHDPDLVFMDVRMPGMSGLEVLDALDDGPAVVFTTAFDEYAVSAFEHGAVDYLVKPFGRERLLTTLARVRVRLVGEGVLGGSGRDAPRGADAESEQPPDATAGGRPLSRVFARDGGALVPVTLGDVIRIDADGSGVRLVTRSGTTTLDVSLTELMERLEPADFVRVHRAHAVNLAHVKSIRRYDERRLNVLLADGSELVASRRGSRLLREMTG